MGILSEETIDWEALERQLEDGNNGGHDNDNNDNGDWLPDDEPEDDDSDTGELLASVGGAVVGFGLGIYASQKATEIANNRNRKHNVISVPTAQPAVENGYYANFDNPGREMATVIGPFVILTAIGAILGKKIENRLRRE